MSYYGLIEIEVTTTDENTAEEVADAASSILEVPASLLMIDEINGDTGREYRVYGRAESNFHGDKDSDFEEFENFLKRFGKKVISAYGVFYYLEEPDISFEYGKTGW